MSEDEEEVMLSGRIPKSLKTLVDADERPNQEVLRAALWREFGGERKSDLERRVEEKEKRINVVEDEVDDRKGELSELYRELDALRSKLDEKEDEEEKRQMLVQEAKEALDGANLIPDNPAVKNWAEKVEMTPEELIEEINDE